MSAPDANLDKQKKNHRGPLVGITIGLVFVAILLVLLIVFVFSSGTDREGDGLVVDGRTGDIVDTDTGLVEGGTDALAQ